MANTPRKHGVNIVELTKGSLALAIAASSIWAVVVSASDADAEVFPIGVPVMVTDPEAAIEDAGAEGTAARTLRAIADCGRSIGVVVRVAEGEGADAAAKAADQTTKVVAALEQLRLCEQSLGVKPRIIAAPGLDTEAVATALGVLGAKLGAIAYAASIGDTPAEVATYRAKFSARELMLIDGDFLAFDPAAGEAGEIAPSFATARAVGLRAYIDREVGYHKTISNVAVPGVSGIESPRSWDLNSAETDIGLINGADVVGLVQRNGFFFWGNRTCSSNPQFAFESAVRTNQVIRDTLASGLFPYIDRPLTANLAKDLVESVNALLRREVRAGRLVGGEAYLANGNTADQLAAGKLRIGYRFTPCAPLEDLGVEVVITDEFYGNTFDLAAA